MLALSEEGIKKIQAAFRGRRAREIHVKRLRTGDSAICPFISSNNEISEKVLRLANIHSDDVVVDLGCGNGMFLVYIAVATSARCIGYDIDPILCSTAVRNAREAGTVVEIYEKDILEANLSGASVIYMFLVPYFLQVLSPLLLQLARGTRIISYHYPLPSEGGWIPAATSETADVVNILNKNSKKLLYLYIVE